MNNMSGGRAHASFAASPDLPAERQLWREVSGELARRFDAAQLLQPGAMLATELQGLVAGRVAAFRRQAAMNGTRGLIDPTASPSACSTGWSAWATSRRSWHFPTWKRSA